MQGKKFKVLIVDDSEINIEVLRFHLEERDFEVIQATNGLEAFDKAHFSEPDIILLDIMMPGVDGFEVCKALKGDEMIQGVPIIFVSAKSQPESLIKGLSMGAVDYVTRPFVPEDLHQRLLMHLAEASSRITVTGETLAMGLSFAGGARKRMLAMGQGEASGISFLSKVHQVEKVGGDVPGFAPVGKDHVVMTMLSIEGDGIKPTLITSTLHSLLSPEPDRGLLCSYVGADLTLRAPEEVIGILEEAFPADRVGHASRLAIVTVNHRTGEYRFASRGIPLIRHLQADNPESTLLTTGEASAMLLENGGGRSAARTGARDGRPLPGGRSGRWGWVRPDEVRSSHRQCSGHGRIPTGRTGDPSSDGFTRISSKGREGRGGCIGGRSVPHLLTEGTSMDV